MLIFADENSVAKQMNHTLVELRHTMVLTAKLLEFLWEPAVEHTAYIQNRSFTTSVQGTTPYEAWQECKSGPLHANAHESQLGMCG